MRFERVPSVSFSFLVDTSSPTLSHHAQHPYLRRLYSFVPGIISCPPLACLRRPVRARDYVVFIFISIIIVRVPYSTVARPPTRGAVFPAWRRRSASDFCRRKTRIGSETSESFPESLQRAYPRIGLPDRYRQNIRIGSKT